MIQALAVAGVLGGASYTWWAAWPLALIGIWFLVASATGFGARPFGPIIDSLGLLTGAAFIAITLMTWTDLAELRRVAGVVAAASYSLWVLGLGWALWVLESPAENRDGFRSHPVPLSANA